MKTLLSLLLACFMLTSASCVIVTPNAKRTTTTPGKGKKKGWYKNRHNPHNPNTDNPGKGKDKKHFTRLDLY